jgi:hypothetical protein
MILVLILFIVLYLSQKTCENYESEAYPRSFCKNSYDSNHRKPFGFHLYSNTAHVDHDHFNKGLWQTQFKCSVNECDHMKKCNY